MSLLDDILAHNREYVEDQNTGYVDTDTKCSKMPSREMAIVTCMDTRLVNFLEDSMDIDRGEAKIVKTAGNCITGPFDGLTEKMLARGISPEAIHMVRKEMERWADGFTHPAENVEETVDELRMNPLIPKDVPIHGLIFHPRTGEIEVIVNGYTQMKQYYEKN
ncbi:MAG: carbonic anhydrase [Veillonella sp.]|nr:carbonic anhydrase [Veillonella sp.]